MFLTIKENTLLVLVMNAVIFSFLGCGGGKDSDEEEGLAISQGLLASDYELVDAQDRVLHLDFFQYPYTDQLGQVTIGYIAAQPTQPIFSFALPEILLGTAASYAGPLPAPSASTPRASCEGATYGDAIPPLSVMTTPGEYFFCLKFVSDSISLTLRSHVLKVIEGGDPNATQFPSLAIISNDATVTNLTLAPLVIVPKKFSEMYITNSAGCIDGGVWEPMAFSKLDWPLVAGADGNAVVYAKFRSDSGYETACLSDVIGVDYSPPADPNVELVDGLAAISQGAIQINVTAPESTEVYLTNFAADCSSGGEWQTIANPLNWSVGLGQDKQSVFYFKSRDAAGNESTCMSKTVGNKIGLTGQTLFTINAGSGYTNSTEVTLAFDLEEITQIYTTLTAGCDANGEWQNLTSPHIYTLPTENARTTIYAKGRDAAGNESECLSASIVHDNIAPVISAFASEGVSINTGFAPTFRFAMEFGVDQAPFTKAFVGLSTSNTNDEVETVTWQETTESLFTFTSSLISLSPGITYYGKLRIEDAAGNLSSVVTSLPLLAYDWNQKTYFKPSVAGASYSYGSSISLSGNSLAIGAVGDTYDQTGIQASSPPTHSSTAVTSAGSVWVYARSGEQWVFEAYLKPFMLNNSAGQGDAFGSVVKLEDDVLAASAPADDTNFTGYRDKDALGSTTYNTSAAASGAVHLFGRTGATWEQTGYLKSEATATNAAFGTFLDLNGDVLAVSEKSSTYSSQKLVMEETDITGASTDSDYETDVVWVFRKDQSGNWQREALFRPPFVLIDADATEFGTRDQSIVVDGDYVIVSGGGSESVFSGIYQSQEEIDALTPPANAGQDVGFVMIYQFVNGSWQVDALIGPPVGYTSIAQGGLSFDGQTLIVGNEGGMPAFAYQKIGEQWTLSQKISPPQYSFAGASNSKADTFGNAVKVSSNSLAIAAKKDRSLYNTVFNGPVTAATFADFMPATATDLNNIVQNNAHQPGGVYLYKLMGGQWVFESYVRPNHITSAHVSWAWHFGQALDLENGTLVVGMPKERFDGSAILNDGTAGTSGSDTDRGAVFSFTRE